MFLFWEQEKSSRLFTYPRRCEWGGLYLRPEPKSTTTRMRSLLKKKVMLPSQSDNDNNIDNGRGQWNDQALAR